MVLWAAVGHLLILNFEGFTPNFVLASYHNPLT